MVVKVLFLILAVIIIGALAILAILAVYNAVHETVAQRKLRKLDEKLNELEEGY